MITTKEAAAMIGRAGSLCISGTMTVKVFVMDVREVYGRTDYQVRPVAGSGDLWVQADRVKVQS